MTMSRSSTETNYTPEERTMKYAVKDVVTRAVGGGAAGKAVSDTKAKEQKTKETVDKD